MNTPYPCSHCQHLYYDAMTKNEPDGYVECKLELPVSNNFCRHFVDEGSEGIETGDGKCGVCLKHKRICYHPTEKMWICLACLEKRNFKRLT